MRRTEKTAGEGRHSDYLVTVEKKNHTLATITVSATSVSDALKQAYLKNCSWQMVSPEDLEQMSIGGM